MCAQLPDVRPEVSPEKKKKNRFPDAELSKKPLLTPAHVADRLRYCYNYVIAIQNQRAATVVAAAVWSGLHRCIKWDRNV